MDNQGKEIPLRSSTTSVSKIHKGTSTTTKETPTPMKLAAGEAIDGIQVPVIGQHLPLIRYNTPEAGKEPLELLGQAVADRMAAKSRLNAYLLDKQVGFRAFLHDRERLMQSQAAELEARRLKLKQAEDHKKKDAEIITKAQLEKDKLVEENKQIEDVNAVLEKQVAEWREKIETLKSIHNAERNRLTQALANELELDNVLADQLQKQEQERIKAEFKVKDHAIAAVRELVNSNNLGPKRQRIRRRPTQYSVN